MMWYRIVFLLLITGILSCNDDDAGPASDNRDANPETFTNGLFITNEGNFEWGEGTLSFYDPAENKVYNRLFESVNGRVLGNVVQSMAISGGNGYIVVNNSGKIEVIDPHTIESKATIDGFNSPRYFRALNDDKAYVTDLYENAVYTVDLNTMEISSKINVSGWTEQMVLIDDHLYVANMGAGEMVVINTATDEIVQEIEVLAEPVAVKKDNVGNIWVLCSGGFQETQPGLFKIDPAAMEVADKYVFDDISLYPNHLTYNPDEAVFYYVANNKVYRFDPSSGVLPESAFIEGDHTSINALYYSKQLGELFLADAKDYNTEGSIFIYGSEGHLRNTKNAGIIPGAFNYVE